MSYISNKRLTTKVIHCIGPSVFRYISHNLNFKRPIFVWFSDLVLIHPIQPPEKIILNAINETPSINGTNSTRGVKLENLRDVWREVIEDETRLRGLYNPQKSQPSTSQLKGQIKSHYKPWLEDAISETLARVNYNYDAPSAVPKSGTECHLQHSNSTNKKSTRNRIVHKIYRKLVNPENYYIPENIRRLLGVLQLRKIKWGIIANSGPHFPEIMGHLAKVEKNRSENGDYFVRLAVAAGKEKPVGSSSATSTIPICNAIDDGYAKPQTAIFKKALHETNRRIVVKSNTAVPLREIYFVGSSAAVDNNVRGLLSLSMKSVLLTESLESPMSDIHGLDSNAVQNLAFFRIRNISELYYALFPKALAEYYCSSLSLNMIAEAAFEPTADSLSTIFKSNNIGVASTTKKEATLSTASSSSKSAESITVSNIPLPETKEMGVSDLPQYQAKPQMLQFDVDKSLKPL